MPEGLTGVTGKSLELWSEERFATYIDESNFDEDMPEGMQTLAL